MIPLCIPEISGNEWNYIKDCLDTNYVSSVGSYVDLFEQKFIEYIGSKRSVVTVNGTSAIHLALKTLGVGEGDEVIVSSMTFAAPVNAIIYCGARPVFADICSDTWVMDAEKIEKLITKKTKAILPVHIYGHPADMDIILELARKYDLFVIEDATEALGSEYKGKKVGTIGDIGCFSFNGNKIITTGGGGMLVTNNIDAGEKAKFLSTQAKEKSDNMGFYHTDIGYNYRLPNVLAAMGVAQLEKLNEFVNIKIENAKYYSSLLSDVKGITLPIEKSWAKNCFWLYSILIDESTEKRDKLLHYLKENGIESRPFFEPIHRMKPYIEYATNGLENTDTISSLGINIPSSVSLKKEEIEYIVNTIKSFFVSN